MLLPIYLSLIFLAIIQGLTEWLPVSSSGILIILEEIIKLEDKNLNLLFNIAVHTGSLIAVITYFKREVFELRKNIKLIKNIKIIKNIIIATIPVIICGFIIKILNLNIFLHDIKIVAFATIVFSIVLYLSDKTKISKKFSKNISNKDSLYIGFAQALALIPGTSRSGITISCARYLGFSRFDSSKFSFLISIPTLFAATVLGAADIIVTFDKNIIFLLALGIFVSLVVSLLCIKLFLKFVENNSLTLFVILRLILGFGLIIYLAN